MPYLAAIMLFFCHKTPPRIIQNDLLVVLLPRLLKMVESHGMLIKLRTLDNDNIFFELTDFFFPPV